MSPTVLKRVALTLAVLVVLWGAFALFRGSLSDDPETLQIRTVAVGDADRIRIVSPGDTLVLRVTGTGDWRVNGLPASRTAVEDLFAATADTAYQAELIARSAGSHERLGVDSADARHVSILRGDDVLVDLFLGSPGRDFRSTYVRPVGSEPVYLFRGRLVNLLARGLDAWRDRNIADLDPAGVTDLAIETPGSRYALTRADDGWRMGDVAADTSTVRELLGELNPLRAAGFPSEAQLDSINFDPPDRRLTVLGAGGDTLLALVFDSTAGGIWVRHDSGGVTWRLDTWRLESLAPPESLMVSSEQ